jgi:hypothetical protein
VEARDLIFLKPWVSAAVLSATSGPCGMAQAPPVPLGAGAPHRPQ